MRGDHWLILLARDPQKGWWVGSVLWLEASAIDDILLKWMLLTPQLGQGGPEATTWMFSDKGTGASVQLWPMADPAFTARSVLHNLCGTFAESLARRRDQNGSD